MGQHSTLGQRIQSYRKAAGLSQEALGEQLGVSRQAVSKWEANSTIPELDNLITMSRIFQISIGQLLGVEEAGAAFKTAETTPNPNNAFGELTERELAAVEAIAARYALETAQHSRPRLNRNRQRRAAIGAAALLLTVLWWGHRQLKAMERQFSDLNRRVEQIDSNMSHHVQQMTGQIEAILAEGASILADSTAILTNFDLKNETITLELAASAKEWTASTTAVFTALISTGEQFLSEPVSQQGGVFRTVMVVPMDHHIELAVTFTDNSAARSESMDPLHSYGRNSFCLKSRGTWAASFNYRTVELTDLSLHIYSPLPSGSITLEPVAGDLCLFRNQETEPEQVIPIRMLRNTYNVQGLPLSLYSIEDEHNAAYELAPGDIMLEVLRLEDSAGQITYTILSGHSYHEKDGIITLDLPDGYLWVPGQ